MQLNGKTAVITGSARGLGKAIALKLAELGANIVLNGSKNSAYLDETEKQFKEKGYNVAAVKGDVSDAEFAKLLIKTAVDTFGKIDILVNNAGITKDKPMLMMSEEDWDSVLDVNLKGAFLCTKAAAKAMLKQKSGKIINISSIVGIIGNPGQANYTASKAGLIGLTKTTAKELASRGITCNAIAPGFIQTDMTEVLPEEIKNNYLKNIPLGRFGTSAEVADLVAFLASDFSNYITGQVINIDVGLVM